MKRNWLSIFFICILIILFAKVYNAKSFKDLGAVLSAVAGSTFALIITKALVRLKDADDK
ncbi:TPA: hypothetical protein DDW69_01435 [candidate division CPR2 bacterium]|nr:MAG: hypothetical protein A2Y27_01340 [candidate division CPR2 bacterium GWD1_39_7]HBG81482.1 hypothetical protein [candidate division CPR2 bacterium]HCL99553.1 hypothetical protein [candidate division CPR2 bacterium]